MSYRVIRNAIEATVRRVHAMAIVTAKFKIIAINTKNKRQTQISKRNISINKTNP